MKIRDGSRETSASQEINDFPSTATKPSFYNKKLFSLYKHSHAPLQEENNLNVALFLSTGRMMMTIILYDFAAFLFSK